MNITAVYENGVFKPRESLDLPEGAEVRLTLASAHLDESPQSIEAMVETDLDRLAALGANWDGYGAPALDRGVLDAARRFISRIPWQTAGQPLIAPLSSGALQFEWHRGVKLLELEVEGATTIHFLKWDPPSGTKDEDVFAIDDLAKAATLIRRFQGTDNA